MKKTRIACGMICKNDSEEKMLIRCLQTVTPYVDAIYITITNSPNKKLQKVCKRFGAYVDLRPGEFKYKITAKHIKWLKKFLGWTPTVKAGDELFLFDEARNANWDFIPPEYEWFFWMDTDDVLRNGKELQKVADAAYGQRKESVFMNYLYHVELEGDKIKNVIIQHLRERLVRMDGNYKKIWKWKGSIHETLIQDKDTNAMENKDIDLVHLSDPDRFQEALTRNMKVLEKEIYTTKGKDPRPIYYLGKVYYDIKTEESFDKAEKLMLRYLSPTKHDAKMSGWTEERSQAWEYMGEMYRARGQHNNSIKCLHNALIEYPQFPSTYYALALSHLCKQDYDNARFWIMMGSKVPMSKTTLVSNPRDYEARAYEVLYEVGINTNRLDEAWGSINRLRELFPSEERYKEAWQRINDIRKEKELTVKFVELVKHLNASGEAQKIKALLSAAPKLIAQNPMIVNIYNEVFPPKTWGKNEITLYAGPQFTAWSPKSLKEPGQGFVGGSEEAIIYLSKELANLGWKVTVYGDPDKDEGMIDGVDWQPFFKFNIKDAFNIVVFWRAPSYLDTNVDAKAKYLWCHDVQNPGEYSEERLKQITKIIVLSEAHRQNLPDIPDKKFMISSNGYYEHLPEMKSRNNPYWCLWTSSYDRGIEHLLEIWPDVMKAVPEAQLHIFYGWQLFVRFNKGNPERIAWKKKIEKMMKQDGVTHHGRVNQLEMEEWHKKCGVWAYPTHFYEINCISAIKSQLWGNIPVTIDYAALKETVKYGKKVDGDIWDPDTKEKYKKELIKALKDYEWQEKERKKMMPWARKKYTWKNIGEQWTKEFGGVKNG